MIQENITYKLSCDVCGKKPRPHIFTRLSDLVKFIRGSEWKEVVGKSKYYHPCPDCNIKDIKK